MPYTNPAVDRAVAATGATIARALSADIGLTRPDVSFRNCTVRCKRVNPDGRVVSNGATVVVRATQRGCTPHGPRVGTGGLGAAEGSARALAAAEGVGIVATGVASPTTGAPDAPGDPEPKPRRRTNTPLPASTRTARMTPRTASGRTPRRRVAGTARSKGATPTWRRGPGVAIACGIAGGLGAGAAGTGGGGVSVVCRPNGSKSVPQLPQKRVSASRGVPHLGQ